MQHSLSLSVEERLTLKEIGKRIAELRRLRGMSQQDLAKILDIPRSSVAQMEGGNRNLSVLELIRLSENFNFSMDRFLAKNYTAVEDLEMKDAGSPAEKSVRVSIPELNLEKFQNVLLYILERCAGKPNVGETVLNKLLYFCDFNYYEVYEEHLTGAEYRKLAYGPVPLRLDTVIHMLVEANKLRRFKTEYHGFSQNRLLPLVKANLSMISAAAKGIIDQVVDRYADMSAAAISDYSHRDMPWKASYDGEIIDYELAFYREPPFSARIYHDDPQ